MDSQKNPSKSTIQLWGLRLLFTMPTAFPGQQGTKQSNILKVSPFSFFFFFFLHNTYKCRTKQDSPVQPP